MLIPTTPPRADGASNSPSSPLISSAPQAAARDEKRRRRIVGTVLLVYVLLLTEGALRKWAFPSYSRALYFIRDPFVIGVYAYALANGMWPKRIPILNACMAFSVLALLLALLQMVAGPGASESSGLVAAYGWRNYFLYIPLAFLIGEHFRERDLKRFALWTLALAVPVSALVYLQFHAAMDSPINVGSGAEYEVQFRGLNLDGEHTRPMGLFTSDAGQGRYVVLALTLAVGYWQAFRGDHLLRRAILYLGSAAVAACLVYSGSRGAMVAAAIVVLALVYYAMFVSRKPEDRAGAARLLAGGSLLGTVAAFVGQDGVNAFIGRWNNAFASESQTFTLGIVGRAFYGFIDFSYMLFTLPLLGEGIGYGGNASRLLNWTLKGDAAVTYSETGWTRHMVDLGPIIGVAFILLRVALTVWLLRRTMRAGNLAGYLLFAAVGLDLLYGPITGQGTLNGFAWMTMGLCIAATREPSTASPLIAPGVSKAKFPHVLTR